MKKLLAAALAGVMVLSLAGCGGEKKETEAPKTEAATEAATTEAATTEAATEAATTEAATTEAAETEAETTEAATTEAATEEETTEAATTEVETEKAELETKAAAATEEETTEAATTEAAETEEETTEAATTEAAETEEETTEAATTEAAETEEETTEAATTEAATEEETTEAATTEAATEEETTEAAATEAETEAETTEAGGTLVMATNAEFPPYEYHEGDEIVGIDAEVAALIAEELGMELEIEDMAFDSVLAAVKSGKADIAMAGITVTEDRMEMVNFTDTYTKATQMIIVAEDSEVAGPDDLEGLTIGVQLGTTGDIYVSDDGVKDAKVERFSKGFEAVQALIQGKVDAVVIDGEPAKVFVAENEGIKLVDEAFTEEEYAIAIAKDNEELLEKINEALATLKESGKFDEVVAKYIGDDDAEAETEAVTTEAVEEETTEAAEETTTEAAEEETTEAA